VRRHALALVKQLDGGRGHPRLDLLVDERVRRRVVVVVDLGVVVDVEPRRFPLGVDEWLGRERLQRGPVEPLEEFPPARPVPSSVARFPTAPIRAAN
jgi:hypothetical protein